MSGDLLMKSGTGILMQCSSSCAMHLRSMKTLKFMEYTLKFNLNKLPANTRSEIPSPDAFGDYQSSDDIKIWEGIAHTSAPSLRDWF